MTDTSREAVEHPLGLIIRLTEDPDTGAWDDPTSSYARGVEAAALIRVLLDERDRALAGRAAAKVKPLVWDGFGLEMWADGIAGRYYISGHNNRWAWAFDDSDPYHHGEDAPTEEAAKAAAQADYERRILDELDLTQPETDALHRLIAEAEERGFWAGRSCGGAKAEIDAALAAIRNRRKGGE